MDLLSLQRDGSLQMMPRNRFVKRGGLILDAAVFFRLVCVDQEYARAAAVFGGGILFLSGRFAREKPDTAELPRRLSATNQTPAARPLSPVPAPLANTRLTPPGS